MSNNRHFFMTVLSPGLGGLLFLCGSLLTVSQAQNLPPEVLRYADTVLYNGHVLTVDRERPPFTVAEAVAIRDGRILAVGEDDRILKMVGAATLKVDLDGKAVMPGVVDTHSHPNSYALSHYNREVTPAYHEFLRKNHVWYANIRWDTKETALADFKKLADNLPPGDWIFTNTYSNPTVRQELTGADLDQAAPNNPLFVRIGYGLWALANSKMLEIVTEAYGDHVPGILKDEKGVPTGKLFGTAGELIDVEVMPQAPPEVFAPAFKKELEEWVAIGVTTLSTRLKGFEINAYGDLDRRGELPLRLPYTHEIGRANPFLERDLKRFGNLEGHGTDRMWLIGISAPNPDGNGPAWATADGLPAPTSGESSCMTLQKREIIPNDHFPNGLCLWDLPDDPGRDAVLIANKYGYRVAGVHNFGDKASLANLAAYREANQERSIAGRRFALDHGMMVSPEVIKQSAELGIMWSFQPPLFYNRYAANVSRIYGEEYAHRWMFPTKSLIDAGVKVAYGADTHSDPQRHPMFNLEVLVTRKTRDGRVFGPREAIDRATALVMMTRWGAEYVLREEELGSIEAGKLADLVVLDKNPLDRNIRNQDLSEIKVVATLIGGEIVFGSLP